MNDEQQKVLSVGEWLVTMIIFAIPCVNIIMVFVWGFGSGGNENRKNYSRAMLVMMLIGIVLSVIFYSIMGAAILQSLPSNI